MKNLAKFVLDNAENNQEEVKKILVELHERGESVEEILEFIRELEQRKIVVSCPGYRVFDVCGTGGSGKNRINLSTALALKLSKKFKIAKHGNRAASGKVGSFDLIEKLGLESCDTPGKVLKNLEEKNVAFVFAPAFHPALKNLAPIRKSLSHPTIFNFLGPLLNPVENLTAQMVGISDSSLGDRLAAVAKILGKNILFVHDSVFGLDDVSVGGKTFFWKVQKGGIEKGSFVPEDYGVNRVNDFKLISGGDLTQNIQIFELLASGRASKAHQDFLEINYRVAEQFFNECMEK
ncbi:anthranilate phosphoribosyltransferase [Candidatus Gracilibacteria bacterium]|nr:anthranilate phosphoribosyltransferase [Candidatus Gracilibacteria bacterium]